MQNIQIEFSEVVRSQKTNSFIENKVTHPHRLSAYWNGYPIRVHDALAEIFPVLRKQIGDNSFYSLAKKYSENCDSKVFDISLIALNFPNFCKKNRELFPECNNQQFEIVCEVAECEKNVMLSFHARNKIEILTPEILAKELQSHGENLRLHFQESVITMPINFDIVTLWKEKDKAEWPTKLDQKSGMLIYRPAWDVQLLTIDEPLIAFIQLLKTYTLGEACAVIQESDFSEKITPEKWIFFLMSKNSLTI